MPQLKPTRGICLNRNHPLSRGLVGLWLFNEGSGGRVFDLSGNGNTGTLAGTAPSWTPGKFGSAVLLPGTDEYIGSMATMGLRVSPGMSISIWAKPNTFAGGDTFSSTNPRYLVMDGTSGGVDPPFCFALRILGGKLNFLYRNAAGTEFVAEKAVTHLTDTSITYHFAAVHTGSEMRLYVNGIKVDSTTTNDPTDNNKEGTTGLCFGQEENINGDQRYFNGQLSSIGIYNRVLSASEIAQLYREPFCMVERKVSPAYFFIAGGEEYIRTIDDGIGVTDVASKASASVRVLAEALGITDSIVKAENKVLTEALGITDTTVKIAVILRTFAEALGLTDATTKISVLSRVLSEALGVTDVVIKAQTKIRTVADDLGIVDETLRVQVQLRVIAETLGLTDLIQTGNLVTIADAMGITDDVTRLIDYITTQSEDIGIADAIVRVAVALRTISDDIGIADEMSIAELVKAAWAFMIIRQTHS